MPNALRSFALTDLAWPEVAAYVQRDPRLILAVGTCDQHGPHLPISATTVIAEALARDLSDEFGVLRAPTFTYGVNVAAERSFPGAASLQLKTLHRALNELLGAWEEQGFREFVLLTAHPYDQQVEALATVSVVEARVRVVNALGVQLGELAESGGAPEHGGEVQTSLLLFLRPDLVQMREARDTPPQPLSALERVRGDLAPLPADGPGSLGRPTLATPERGQRIYEYILHRIRQKIFLAPDEDEEEE